MKGVNYKKYSSEDGLSRQAHIFSELKSENFGYEQKVINVRHQGPERNLEGNASTPSSIQQAYMIARTVLVGKEIVDKPSKFKETRELGQLYSKQVADVLEVDQKLLPRNVVFFFNKTLRKDKLTLGYEKEDLDCVGSLTIFKMLHKDFQKSTNVVLDLLKNTTFARFIHIVGSLDRFGPIYKQSNRFQSLQKIEALDMSYEDLVLGLKTFIDDKGIDIEEKVRVTGKIFQAFNNLPCEQEQNLIKEYAAKGRSHYEQIEQDSEITDISEDGKVKFVETNHRLSIGAEIVYGKGGKIAVAFNPEDKDCFIVKGSPEVEGDFDTLLDMFQEKEKEYNQEDNWIGPRTGIIRSPQKTGTQLSSEEIKEVVRKWSLS